MNFDGIVPTADPALEAWIRRRLDSLTKPPGSLGRMETLALRLGLIQGTGMPSIGRKAMLIFCADHGVVEEGVSAYPDRKSTRLNSSHLGISYAVFCLKKKIRK